jgi:hypothetical protein
MTDRGEAEQWAGLGVEAGICRGCRHAKLNGTRRGTVYLRCLRATWDARLTRYPRLPVLECPGFEAGSGADADPGSDHK